MRELVSSIAASQSFLGSLPEELLAIIFNTKGTKGHKGEKIKSLRAYTRSSVWEEVNCLMIKLVESEQDIDRCYEVMVQLRTHLERKEFLTTIKRMQSDGYQLAFLEDQGEVRSGDADAGITDADD